MRIELIETYNKEYPKDKIIRIMSYSKSDLKYFAQSIDNLIKNNNNLNISDSKFVSKSDINLTFVLGKENIGTTNDENDRNKYICTLKPELYTSIIKIINNIIANNLRGYSWLYDINIDIDILLSENGKW